MFCFFFLCFDFEQLLGWIQYQTWWPRGSSSSGIGLAAALSQTLLPTSLPQSLTLNGPRINKWCWHWNGRHSRGRPMCVHDVGEKLVFWPQPLKTDSVTISDRWRKHGEDPTRGGTSAPPAGPDNWRVSTEAREATSGNWSSLVLLSPERGYKLRQFLQFVSQASVLTRIILAVVGGKGVGGLTMASLGLLILRELVTAVLFRFLAKNA